MLLLFFPVFSFTMEISHASRWSSIVTPDERKHFTVILHDQGHFSNKLGWKLSTLLYESHIEYSCLLVKTSVNNVYGVKVLLAIQCNTRNCSWLTRSYHKIPINRSHHHRNGNLTFTLWFLESFVVAECDGRVCVLSLSSWGPLKHKAQNVALRNQTKLYGYITTFTL